MDELKPNEYRCAMCHKVYGKGQTDEEAAAEAKANFGDLRPGEGVTICDFCFQKIHPDKFPREAEQAVADMIRARVSGN